MRWESSMSIEMHAIHASSDLLHTWNHAGDEMKKIYPEGPSGWKKGEDILRTAVTDEVDSKWWKDVWDQKTDDVSWEEALAKVIEQAVESALDDINKVRFETDNLLVRTWGQQALLLWIKYAKELLL